MRDAPSRTTQTRGVVRGVVWTGTIQYLEENPADRTCKLAFIISLIHEIIHRKHARALKAQSAKAHEVAQGAATRNKARIGANRVSSERTSENI